MAKGHWSFRPKDKSILDYMRQQAQKANRSMNNWLEQTLSKQRESEKWAKEDKR